MFSNKIYRRPFATDSFKTPSLTNSRIRRRSYGECATDTSKFQFLFNTIGVKYKRKPFLFGVDAYDLWLEIVTPYIPYRYTVYRYYSIYRMVVARFTYILYVLFYGHIPRRTTAVYAYRGDTILIYRYTRTHNL